MYVRVGKKMDSVCFKWFDTGHGCHKHEYHIEGNFLEVQFSWMVDLYYFAGSVFMDASTHAHYVLCNRAVFASLILVVRRSSTKTTKIGPLEISRYMGVSHHNHAHQPFPLQAMSFLLMHTSGLAW